MGKHKYNEDVGLSHCAYGCGAWAANFSSGAPAGIDPLGECPNAPKKEKKPLTVTIEVEVDHEQERLWLKGYNWEDIDLNLCAHGIKETWGCDDCEKYFESLEVNNENKS